MNIAALSETFARSRHDDKAEVRICFRLRCGGSKETPEDPAISSSSKVKSSVAELELSSRIIRIFDASAFSPAFSFRSLCFTRSTCFFLLLFY